MKNIIIIARGLWTKALAIPGIANILIGLGIYALEELVKYLRDEYRNAHKPPYNPTQFIEMGV